MAKFEYKIIDQKQVWENFILSQSPRSFLQSWNWGETNKIEGKTIFRMGIYKNTYLVGAALIIKENAKRGRHFLIPGGPFIDWKDKPLVDFFISTIKDLAVKEKVWFIRVRPELIDDTFSEELFNHLGFFPAPMHLHAENTWVLNINADENSLLYGMRKNTRYNIRKSLDAGLNIVLSTDPDDAHILTELQKETVDRHHFTPFPERIFRAQLETFGKDREGVLFICKKGRQALAAAIILFYGKSAYYHHSASTSKYSNIPFSYFLQWQIIMEAKKRGCTAYNFWGIAPNNNPKHRFAGVTIFKTGFGGERIDWLHARDLPISPFYWTTHIFETGRKINRRL